MQATADAQQATANAQATARRTTADAYATAAQATQDAQAQQQAAVQNANAAVATLLAELTSDAQNLVPPPNFDFLSTAVGASAKR